MMKIKTPKQTITKKTKTKTKTQWGTIYGKTADEYIGMWSLYPAVCLLVGKKVSFKACFECAKC
jgi:hypothetical protein